jgi:hypothetical protein
MGRGTIPRPNPGEVFLSCLSSHTQPIPPRFKNATPPSKFQAYCSGKTRVAAFVFGPLHISQRRISHPTRQNHPRSLWCIIFAIKHFQKQLTPGKDAIQPQSTDGKQNELNDSRITEKETKLVKNRIKIAKEDTESTEGVCCDAEIPKHRNIPCRYLDSTRACVDPVNRVN